MRGASEPSPKKKIEGDLDCDRPLRLAAEGSIFSPRDEVDYIEPLLRESSTNQHNDRVSMTDSKPHRWQFAARFRRNAFAWRSQPAIERVREAVVEIRKVARRDPVLAAEGAVLFLEKAPALEHVDSSSGSIGTAVNHAIEELVSIIAKAPVDLGRRARLLIDLSSLSTRARK
jgi:hypothetical protein